jgi:hypothetical protein
MKSYIVKAITVLLIESSDNIFQLVKFVEYS